MKQIDLKKISVDDLLTLRDRINVMLAGRVTRERHDLETRLKRLEGFIASAEPPGEAATANKKHRKNDSKKAKKATTKKVAVKYRNPENHAET